MTLAFRATLTLVTLATAAVLAAEPAAPAAKPAQKAGAPARKGDANVVKALVKTSMGDIEIELDKAKAPISVENFVRYAKDGHYTNTIFHRVIADFMIQGGGFDANMQQKPVRAPIKNESDNGLANDRGTVAMARTSAPDSATSQFYISLKNNDFLNGAPGKPGYTVFGRVTKGMEVVDKIAAVKTGRMGPHGDVPQAPVYIESVEIQ